MAKMSNNDVVLARVKVPQAGMEHDFINTGAEDMKLFTVYSPPEHPDGVVHATKADALAHPEE